VGGEDLSEAVGADHPSRKNEASFRLTRKKTPEEYRGKLGGGTRHPNPRAGGDKSRGGGHRRGAHDSAGD